MRKPRLLCRRDCPNLRDRGGPWSSTWVCLAYAKGFEIALKSTWFTGHPIPTDKCMRQSLKAGFDDWVREHTGQVGVEE
jgi:hypothetical protein